MNPFANSPYHSKRPFLIVETSIVPRKGVNTSVKGWQNNPTNVQTTEHVTIVDRIKPRHMTATVVIDLFNSTVVQTRVTIEHDKLLEHYMGKYRNDISAAISKWAAKPEIAEAVAKMVAEHMVVEGDTEQAAEA